MTLRQELLELDKLPRNVEVDLSRYAYGNDSAYIYRMGRNLGMRISTRLSSDGRMMVRIREDL